jgi:hypothetical protein
MVAVPLVAFYLWSPSVSSRYQLDLAPGFVALLVIAWRQLALTTRASVALAILFVAWGAAVATSKTTASRNTGPVDGGTAELAAYRISRPIIHARDPVTSYDLRYSTVAPGGDVNAWFNSATQATGEPQPAGCGCRDGLCIPGLNQGTTYYFGLKAVDEARNASPVSNIVSAQPGTATGDMHIAEVVSSWTYAGGVKKRGAVAPAEAFDQSAD